MTIEKNNSLNNTEIQDYEKKFGLKEKHNSLLSILTVFHDFCKKNNINYSLGDGTLLGAIRHGDFIPWDDDADVMVTRGEYNKIIKALEKNDTNIRLFKSCFLDRLTSKEAYKNKEYIDLFINDVMPKCKLAFKAKVLFTKFLRGYFFSKDLKNFRHNKLDVLIRNLLGPILRLIVKLLIGKKDIFELNDKYVQIGNLEPSDFYTRFTSRMFETKRRFNRKSYDEGFCEINFRGKKLQVIKNAKNFLKEMYGNFEDLPDESKRYPEHSVNMLEVPDFCIKKFGVWN